MTFDQEPDSHGNVIAPHAESRGYTGVAPIVLAPM